MPFVKPEKRFFNKEKFIAGLDAVDKDFYKAVRYFKFCYVLLNESFGFFRLSPLLPLF